MAGGIVGVGEVVAEVGVGAAYRRQLDVDVIKRYTHDVDTVGQRVEGVGARRIGAFLEGAETVVEDGVSCGAGTHVVAKTYGVVAARLVVGQVGPGAQVEHAVGKRCGELQQRVKGVDNGLPHIDKGGAGLGDLLHERSLAGFLTQLVGHWEVLLRLGAVVGYDDTHGVVLHVDTAAERRDNAFDGEVVLKLRKDVDMHLGEVAWAVLGAEALQVVGGVVEELRRCAPPA